MSFDKHFKKTTALEGGYSNHSLDRGGETYKGIARKFHKAWSGWEIIDRYKSIHGTKRLNSVLQSDKKLQGLVKSFYKKTFWDRYRLDEINSDLITGELYDSCVNMGSRPIKWLQENVNIFRIKKGQDLLVVDGKIGSATVRAVNKIVKSKIYERVLFKSLDTDQGAFYKKIVKKNKSQAVFYVGWMEHRTR